MRDFISSIKGTLDKRGRILSNRLTFLKQLLSPVGSVRASRFALCDLAGIIKGYLSFAAALTALLSPLSWVALVSVIHTESYSARQSVLGRCMMLLSNARYALSF